MTDVLGDIRSTATRLRSGDVTPFDLVSDCLDSIARLDPVLNACISIESSPTTYDLIGDASSDSMMWGLPVGVKDNILVRGLPATAGSPRFRDHIPREDASAVKNLRNAGALVIAKTNMDELGFGGKTENPLFGRTANPWDPTFPVGGSSGGSAAAVAAGMFFAALGTDTGGSVRNPAAWCGVVGFKPTYGVIKTVGVFPLAWSLDTVGVIARSVADVECAYSAIAGRRETGEPEPAEAETCRDGKARLRLGVVQNLVDGSHDDVAERFTKATESIVATADLQKVVIPGLDDAVYSLMTIMFAEAAGAWEGDLDQNWDQYGSPVRSLIEAGRLIRASEYLHAQRMRRHFATEVALLSTEFDALLMPTMGLAPSPGVLDAGLGQQGSDLWHLEGRFTGIWNLVGYPAISLPYDLTHDRVPLGMQIVGRPHQDRALLGVANRVEQALSFEQHALRAAMNRWSSHEPELRDG